MLFHFLVSPYSNAAIVSDTTLKTTPHFYARNQSQTGGARHELECVLPSWTLFAWLLDAVQLH